MANHITQVPDAEHINGRTKPIIITHDIIQEKSAYANPNYSPKENQLNYPHKFIQGKISIRY